MTSAPAAFPAGPSRPTSRRGSFLAVAIAAALLLQGAAARAETGSPAGSGAMSASSWWGRLDVRDLGGARLDPPGRWFVVIFLGQDCPVSNGYIPVLNRLSAEFTPRGFVFVGAYADPTADLPALRAHASDYSIGFRLADDRAHRLVRVAGANYTPEVAVFSSTGAKLYEGRIDDRVGELGASRPAATRQELRDVLNAIAAGSPGPFKGTPGYGCAIPEAVGG
jgi:hypothetical protein